MSALMSSSIDQNNAIDLSLLLMPLLNLPNYPACHRLDKCAPKYHLASCFGGGGSECCGFWLFSFSLKFKQVFVESYGSAIRVMSSLERKGILRIWIFIHECSGWPCRSSSGGVMLVHKGTVADNLLALKHQISSRGNGCTPFLSYFHLDPLR